MRMHLYGVRMLMAAGLLIALAQSPTGAAPLRTFAIREPFGLAWGPDRVAYRVEFAQAEARPEALSLTDGQGRAVPMQLTDVEYWPDQTVKSACLSFMASLRPDESAAWTLLTEPGIPQI